MAVLRKVVTILRCERCGYEWPPNDPDTLPAVCSNKECKSPAWNKPRPKARHKAT
jgi:hypothetical protein